MTWIRLGAALCFLAVALGAFGAHALQPTLAAHNGRDIWQTAVLYHFLHGLALIVVASLTTNRMSCYFFLAGVVLFSGSLYALALTKLGLLGAIAPLGGLCFLAGWAWLFFSSR